MVMIKPIVHISDVVIQKVDLDTCLTAFILGVQEGMSVKVYKGDARESELKNKSVLCIEVGGSGRVTEMNFDHHDDVLHDLPSACKQAFDFSQCQDKQLKILVEYVCQVDRPTSNYQVIPFPSLSNIFSGMQLTEQYTLKQFFKGLEILQIVHERNLNPFEMMPELPEWNTYRHKKEENYKKLQNMTDSIKFFSTHGGLKIGYSEYRAIGGIRALFKRGCHIVILFHNSFGEDAIRKFTIASDQINIRGNLLKIFRENEEGWGGHETILGSPRKGSVLDPSTVIQIVIENM